MLKDQQFEALKAQQKIAQVKIQTQKANKDK
jgi:hypothetical protein